jgi:hypothetical protein
MFWGAKNLNQPIYFKLYESNYEIFEKSLMENNEKKYILKPELYNKLILFYVLNQINEELLYLFDN